MKAGIWIFVTVFGFSLAEEATKDEKIWEEWVPWSEYSLFPTLPIAAPLSEDKQCREDSRRLITHLKNQTLWAMQMWDSSATSTFGALYGNRYHLGNYDECLTVTRPIEAHYCLTIIRATVHRKDAFEGDFHVINPDPNATVWRKVQNSRRDRTQYPRDESEWGLCVPSSCNATEMEKAINLYLGRLNERLLKTNGTTYEVEIPVDRCYTGTEDEMSYGEMGFWVFTWSIIILVVIATSVDIAKKKELVIEESPLEGYLMKFSLKRNVLTLMDRDEGGRAKETSIIYGIRFYNVCYIVTDHRMGILLSTVIFNSQKFEEDFRSWLNILLPHGDLLVDTYFFIGGYLATLNLLDIYKRGFYNPLRVILHRFCRGIGSFVFDFTSYGYCSEFCFEDDHFSLVFIVSRTSTLTLLAPLYFYIVWFHASALLRLGSGPVWKYGLQDEADFCRKNWWANVLFIQNYVNPQEMCMLHAWYLPCDMHFFILAILLIILLRKNKKVGFYVLHILTFVAIITPGIVTYVYELQPLISFNPKFVNKPRLDPSFEHLYVKSHTRAAVYLMGILTAYYLFERRESTWKISKTVSVLTCCVGLGFLFAPMLYGSLYYNPKKEYNLAEAVIFSILRRFSWAMGWVLFMVVNRFGIIPIFGKVFTWKISVPLSKTTYAIYLIHFVIQMADEAKAKLPYQFISFEMVFSDTPEIAFEAEGAFCIRHHGMQTYFVQVPEESLFLLSVSLSFHLALFVKGTNDLFFATGYALVLYLVIELPFRLLFKELLFPTPKKKPQALPEGEHFKQTPPQIFSIKL